MPPDLHSADAHPLRTGSPATPEFRLRAAAAPDTPAITTVIDASVRRLSVDYYSSEQIEDALRYVFGVDSQLIADGTYYVIEAEGEIVAAGGWSARRTLYGGDQAKSGEDARLDPAVDAARIRAFFVHPRWARRGLGRRLFAACEDAAASAGFRRFELVATLPGVPLYAALGFVRGAEVIVEMPGGVPLPCVRMSRPITVRPAP